MTCIRYNGCVWGVSGATYAFLHLESEDLPFERDDKWLNMDQFEHDKLRWLTPLDKEDKKKKDQKNKVRNIM
mgnify:CR=1 FL=1